MTAKIAGVSIKNFIVVSQKMNWRTDDGSGLNDILSRTHDLHVGGLPLAILTRDIMRRTVSLVARFSATKIVNICAYP